MVDETDWLSIAPMQCRTGFGPCWYPAIIRWHCLSSMPPRKPLGRISPSGRGPSLRLACGGRHRAVAARVIGGLPSAEQVNHECLDILTTGLRQATTTVGSPVGTEVGGELADGPPGRPRQSGVTCSVRRWRSKDRAKSSTLWAGIGPPTSPNPDTQKQVCSPDKVVSERCARPRSWRRLR